MLEKQSERSSSGKEMYSLMQELWPICRSITGNGVRETFKILQRTLINLKTYEVPTGTKCFDWTIPNEWSISEAYIIDPKGRRIADFHNNNLHLVNYSAPIKATMELAELQKHLHSLPDQPEAIPYVTSYYKENWGFCLKHSERERLESGEYQVVINSKLQPGSLTYGELIVKGESDEEILISTYICHPSMANNELSGPCVTTGLASWLSQRHNKFSYRIIFVPETIGAICYLSRNLDVMKKRTIAGFVVNCVGDEKAWSFLPSKSGSSLCDNVCRHVLKHLAPNFKEYSFLTRGSDERQYCSPGVDLPVASIMRSKYATYPEYHTSLDNLNFVSAKGLGESLDVYKKVIETLEVNTYPQATVLCEPKMSDRGLRPTIGKRGSADAGKTMMDLLMYADGKNSILDIANILGVPAWELAEVAQTLHQYKLLK